MDKWKYFDITHKDHIFCNPLSEEKFNSVIDIVKIPPNAHIIDIATGKAEFILRMAERYYQISGIGIDLSPYCIRDAKRKYEGRCPEASLKFIEMDGADFKPDTTESFDLVACLGASWIYDGHYGTLNYLKKLVKKGGYVITGEPFWIKKPPKEYLEMSGEKPDSYATHYENVKIGEKLGLTLLYTVVSNDDDWDKYEGLQWNAAENYKRENPDDEDLPEIMENVNKDRELYLKYGREVLGWAVYIFRKQ